MRFFGRQQQEKQQHPSSSSYDNEKFRQAEIVCQNIPLAHLLQNTIYKSEINQIYFKYAPLKLFAHPLIFPHIAQYIADECEQCRQRFPVFSVHVDIEGLTVTGAHRYKDIISNLLMLCECLNTDFSSSIDTIHIYNSPPSIEMLRSMLMPFLVTELREKLIFH